MTNETQNFESTNSTSEANSPQSEGIGSKVKNYGKKSFTPMMDVLHKYQGEITPYFTSIEKAIQGAIGALKADNATESDKMVSEWFSEASSWLTETRGKLESTDSTALMNYLQEQGRTRPAVMFGTSYVAGLFFGRLGRHVGRQFTNGVPAMPTGDDTASFGSSEGNSSLESGSGISDPNLH